MTQYAPQWVLAQQLAGAHSLDSKESFCQQHTTVQANGYSKGMLAPSASSDESMADSLCQLTADELFASTVSSLWCSTEEGGSCASVCTAISSDTPRSAPPQLTVDPALASGTAAEAAFRNLRTIEIRNLQSLGCTGLKLPHDPNYLSASLRSVAVSWLVEVVSEFNLTQDTLFLAVALFDRLLQVTEPIQKHHTQLVAITCLYVASKVEEERFPSAALCVRIADGCFRSSDVLRMETILLNSLGFNVHIPTSLGFVRLLVQLLGLSKPVEQRALLLAELALLDLAFASAPSWVTATACTLAAMRQANLGVCNWPALGNLRSVLACEVVTLEPWVAAVLQLHHMLMQDTDSHALHYPIMDKYLGW